MICLPIRQFSGNASRRVCVLFPCERFHSSLSKYSSTSRVEWRRDRFRPMGSCVSALSSIVANSPRVLPTFPPPLYSFRMAGFPQYGWKPASSSGALPTPLRASFDAGAAVHPFPAISYPASGTAAAPTGPWLSAVYHVRACKRYYGLMRQSDELRPAWLYQLTLAGLCPGRAVRLTFCGLREGLPQPGSPLARVCYHYSAQASLAEAGLAPASVSKTEGCTQKFASSPRHRF